MGGALMGAGKAMITNPVEKMKEDEHMEMGDYLDDVTNGGFIGGVIGNFFNY